MKNRKLLALAVILMITLFAANIHAQEAAYPAEANNNIAFGAEGLFAFDKIGVSMGPGLQVSWYNSKLFMDAFGLGVHVGILMPIYEQKLNLAISGIVGATYTVFDNGVFAIPITAGLHFDYITAIYDPEIGLITYNSAINLGLGVVGDFVWRFSEKWHAYGRVAFALNFGAFEFLLMPGIGVGVRF